MNGYSPAGCLRGRPPAASQGEEDLPMRLWQNADGNRRNKYLVQRRDASVPDWPWFVLSAKDPAAPDALRAYADAAETAGMDPAYIADVRGMADEWDAYRTRHGVGDPDAPPHRKDDPAVVAALREEED